MELLDANLIADGLSSHTRARVNDLRVAAEVDSTNRFLRDMPVEAQHGAVLLAESQTAGRGRRGRDWFSPVARNLYLSVGWRFETGIAALGCLPLAIAVGASRALTDCGMKNHGIKWPNDLLIEGRKLGGCLVEVQGDAQGPCDAIIGVGINVNMPSSLPGADRIDQPWTDLSSHVEGASRNRLASKLISRLIDVLDTFSSAGFASFVDEWARLDVLRGAPVTVEGGGGRIHGIAAGVSARGGLLVENEDGTTECHSGEVSVRRG